MIDLVLNHTSDRHPWFRSACADQDSPYRDWYVWSDAEPPDRWDGAVFPGSEDATWTYQQEAGRWYRHRFYSWEPDLNTDHPAVRDEFRKIMGFWLRLGVAGFRVEEGQWATFLRNHDEVDLSALTPQERQDVFREFSPEPDMRVYERGIGRRMASMLCGDRRRIELAYSLLLSMPGTPVIRYGDEIGMGEDLALPERDSVRTPMQWTDTRNAGLSTAPPDRLIAPVIADGPYRHQLVNVLDQRRDPDSLLTWFERILHTRRECEEIGVGDHEVVDVGERDVLAHIARGEHGLVLFVHNFGERDLRLQVPPLPGEAHRPLSVAADGEYPEDIDLLSLEVRGRGYRWLRLNHTPWD